MKKIEPIIKSSRDTFIGLAFFNEKQEHKQKERSDNDTFQKLLKQEMKNLQNKE